MNKTQKWTYTLKDVSEASGTGINTVRDHKESGRLIPSDLRNVAKYIVSYILREKNEWIKG